MKQPRVLNIRAHPTWALNPNATYIGRPNSNTWQHWGNPFTHLPGTKASVQMATRELAIQAFRDWLCGTGWKELEQERRAWMLKHLNDLKGRDLVCWCAPQACHGDVLLELANKDFRPELLNDPAFIDVRDHDYLLMALHANNCAPEYVHELVEKGVVSTALAYCHGAWCDGSCDSAEACKANFDWHKAHPVTVTIVTQEELDQALLNKMKEGQDLKI